MLLLLHGLSSDATSYMRFTSIERYAEAHQLAVIMPNADHSGYHVIVITFSKVLQVHVV
jgi:putative tributyrin esterase